MRNVPEHFRAQRAPVRVKKMRQNKKLERNGFTLVEALVAFAILALVMSELLEGVSGAVRNDDRAEFLLRAARLGRSQLDALGVSSPIAVGETAGYYDGGLPWTLSIQPLRPTASSATLPRIAAFWARVTIHRPGARRDGTDTLSLTALKLIAIEDRRP